MIGTGYLGATHAAAMAELGFTVVGADPDAAKISAFSEGRLPFFEPGLGELVASNISAGRLTFTTDVAKAVRLSDIHFICVGTPQRLTSHAANLDYVESAVADVVRNLDHDALIVGKSTVPVGTAARLREIVDALVPEGIRVELIWNPEFLREGRAVEDTLSPDRIVIGGGSDWAHALMKELYATPIANGSPYIVCDLPTAELVKVSANAFLATKISFINAIAELCSLAGADVDALADAIGHDPRIGRQFLNAGLGFGGGCLPKDIRALMHRAGELGARQAVGLMQQVDEINMDQRQRVIELTVSALGGSVLNRRIGVLGAAFKPDTDDVRDSPALNVAAGLHLRGAQVAVHDPAAGGTGSRMFPTLTFVDDAVTALSDADVLLVLTEWPEFVNLDPRLIGTMVRSRIVIDARNCLPADVWRAAGWRVIGLGRGLSSPAAVDARVAPLFALA